MTAENTYPRIQWFDYENQEPIEKPGGDGGFAHIDIAPLLRWEAWHGISDRSDQVDGHIGPRTLDIWYADAPGTDDLRKDYPEISKEAKAIWDLGQVMCKGLWPSNGDNGIPSLIIPGEHFTEASLLEAFRRFHP